MNSNSKFEKLRESWIDFDEFKARYQKVEVAEYPNNVIKAVPNPEISVLLVTYQHAEYIREAIESVLMQKLDVPWEIIIGDDESTDGTREICVEYAKKYPDLIRLFLHKRENNRKVLGKPCGIFQIMYNTYNLRGKYIAVLSGDDYWTSNVKLKKQLYLLKTRNDLSFVYTPFRSAELINNKKVLGDIKNSFPKASSVMYLNIFHLLPQGLIETLNEDVFFQSISKMYGSSAITNGCGCTVYNTNAMNMWNSNKGFDKEMHRANLNKHLWLTFKDTCRKFEIILSDTIVNYKEKEKVGLSLRWVIKNANYRLYFFILRSLVKKIVKNTPIKLLIW